MRSSGDATNPGLNPVAVTLVTGLSTIFGSFSKPLIWAVMSRLARSTLAVFVVSTNTVRIPATSKGSLAPAGASGTNGLASVCRTAIS